MYDIQSESVRPLCCSSYRLVSDFQDGPALKGHCLAIRCTLLKSKYKRLKISTRTAKRIEAQNQYPLLTQIKFLKSKTISKLSRNGARQCVVSWCLNVAIEWAKDVGIRRNAGKVAWLLTEVKLPEHRESTQFWWDWGIKKIFVWKSNEQKMNESWAKGTLDMAAKMKRRLTKNHFLQ